jgi:hypothetical protein
MAEYPERWTERTPERQLFDRTPAFGLAREAERLPEATAPALAPTEPPVPRRLRGPFVTHLLLPWSYGGTTGDRWHRLTCWFGRHQMGGGHTVQLDSTLVYIERRCRWCGAGGSP